MLYLRSGAEPETFDVWSTVKVDHPLMDGLTEFEVRKFFRDRAIGAARVAVNEMLETVMPYVPKLPTAG